MEQVLKTYGIFLLEAVAFILFWVLAFRGIRDTQGNTGVFSMAGAQLVEEQKAYGSDFACCVEESRRSAPALSYKKAQALHVGEYEISELVLAVDDSGRELPLQLQCVFNPQGVLESSSISEDCARICFREPGIYQLQIYVIDEWNNETTCRIAIPVNNWEEAM